MADGSLMSLLMLPSMILSVAFLSCLCCMCMKFRDLRLRNCIVQMAKKKGIKVELEKPPEQPHELTVMEQNCTIMVPDVAIVL